MPISVAKEEDIRCCEPASRRKNIDGDLLRARQKSVAWSGCISGLETCDCCWQQSRCCWHGERSGRTGFRRGGWGCRWWPLWLSRCFTRACCGRGDAPCVRSRCISVDWRGLKIAGWTAATEENDSATRNIYMPPIWICLGLRACSRCCRRRARGWERIRWRRGFCRLSPVEMIRERQAAVAELRDRPGSAGRPGIAGEEVGAGVAPEALLQWAEAPAELREVWLRWLPPLLMVLAVGRPVVWGVWGTVVPLVVVLVVEASLTRWHEETDAGDILLRRKTPLRISICCRASWRGWNRRSSTHRDCRRYKLRWLPTR